MINTDYLQLGSIVGLFITGILADLFFRKTRWSLLFLMNMVLLALDIYVFVYPECKENNKAFTITFSIVAGAIRACNDLMYLVLVPIMITRKLEINVLAATQKKISLGGTIFGVVLAFELSGQYLISKSAGTMLALLT